MIIVRAQATAHFQNLQKVMKSYQGTLDIQILDEEQMASVPSQISEGSAPCPFIGACCGYEYLIDDKCFTYKAIAPNGEECVRTFDFAKSMPVILWPTLTILTTDISQTIEIENFISEQYSVPHTLTFCHPDIPNEEIFFDIRRSEAAIDRRSVNRNGKTYYQSVIELTCNFCPSFWKTFHPAEVTFSQRVQSEIIMKLKALEDLRDLYEKNNPMFLFRAPSGWAKRGYTPTDEELQTRERYKMFRKIQEDIISSLPFDDKVKDDVDSYFRDVCKKVLNDGNDILTAIKKIHEEREEIQEQYEQKNRLKETAKMTEVQFVGTQCYEESSGGGFFSSMLKELGREKAQKERVQTEEATESVRRRQRAVESQRQWLAVKKANEERRRKGQPELPLPPREWY